MLIIYLIILSCSGADRGIWTLDLLYLKTRCFFLEKKGKVLFPSLDSFGTKSTSVVFGTLSASQDLGATNPWVRL